jgi:hypothetical protein
MMMFERHNGSVMLCDARVDKKKAEIVEAAIAIAEESGKALAGPFLHNHGVSFSVTVRALNERNLRRPVSRSIRNEVPSKDER